MKLRYYLRGLGIGMIVTALLMGVALKDKQPLSDAEIRVRAMELGMVDGDSRTLADIQASQEPGQSSPDVPVPEETPEVSAEPASTPVPEEEPASTAAPDSDEKPLPMVTPKASPDTTADVFSTPVDTLTPEQTASTTFVVSSGQSSYTVSKSLVEAGLVEDASEFDRYLEENGYSKKINPGTYEIPLDASQEEIAKIITRSR